MKVAIVGPYPMPNQKISGGVERVIETLISELKETVHVTVIAPNANRSIKIRSDGVDFIYLKKGKGNAIANLIIYDPSAIKKELDRIEPDIVHFQGISSYARGCNRPSLLTLHGIAHLDAKYRAGESHIKRAARLLGAFVMKQSETIFRHQIGNVVVINPYVLEVLPDVKELRKFSIPNPISNVYLGPIQPERKAQRIISAGRIGAGKNTLEAVRLSAAALRLNPRASAVFYGAPENGHILEQCISVAKEQGVLDRVSFPGNIDASQLRAELDCSSVYLTTSLRENAPVAIAEALARGLPVVTPRTHGMKYMIDEGINGFFLPEGRENDKVQVIQKALNFNWNHFDISKGSQTTYAPREIASSTLSAYHAIRLNE